MDYHSLKRKELQALCKDHNIPANSANAVLADKLSALLNEKQKPITRKRTCMKSSVETSDEGEPAASKRQSKKVRFSPSNDMVEYELRSGEKQKATVTQIKSRRKSVAKKVDEVVVENSTTVESVDDSVQIPVKLTRSRMQSSGKDVVIPNVEKKQSGREAKNVKQGAVVDKETEGKVGKVTRSKAHILEIAVGVQREESRQSKRVFKDVEKASEPVKETVVSRARVTRSKAQTSMEDGTGPDVNPHVKEKSGKQVETDALDVGPSKEAMDIPVRATRSRRQTPTEDVVNTDANPKADKKRTRREIKAEDSSSNLTHVAPVDKQEPPKRKSLRTRGVEAVDKDEGDKVEVANNGKVTRSKASLETEASGKNSKNKAIKVEVQQPEEPSKNAGKKNVNRRKSVLQPEKTEVVLHPEEPLNRPARNNSRRKSVMQKAITAVKKQSKGDSGSLSMIVEGLEGKESVIRSGKDTIRNEFKEVTSGSSKSRKRKGTPVLEDQVIETRYDSYVDKSPKRSTRSASKSEGKSVVKKQVESSSKKPVSRMNSLSSVEKESEGKSLAIGSSAIVRDSSSKKRAKLSGMKQSGSEDHDVNSGKEGTPVAKMGNLKLEEVTEPEVTPAIDISDRRSTRSTIKSERKEPSQSAIKERATRSTIRSERKEPSQSAIKEQRSTRSTIRNERKEPSQPAIKEQQSSRSTIRSERKEPSQSVIKEQQSIHSIIKSERKASRQSAIKEQPIAEAQLSSPKPAKFRHDPAVNTAPGRITRSGIKRGGNTAGSFTEMVGKKKQANQSAHKKQPLDDAQTASPEVAEVGPNPDFGTMEGLSEMKQPLDEVQMYSPEITEAGPDPDADTVGVQSEFKKRLDDAQTSSHEVAEVRPNSDSDTIGVGSEISKEGTGQIMDGLSTSESVRLTSEVMEENKVSPSGTFIDMENVSLVSGEKASGEVLEDVGACIEKSTYEASETPCLTESLLAGKQQNPLELQNFDDETPSGKNLSHIKMTSVLISDGSHVQDQSEDVYVESKIFSEAVNLEKSVLKSGRPDAKEKKIELIESGTTSKRLLTDVMTEEPLVSVSKVVVVEEGVDISSLGVVTEGHNGDADKNSDSISYNVGSSTINGPNELETGLEMSNVNKTIEDPVSGNSVDIECGLEDNSDMQDGESKHDQLTSNDNQATHEVDVEGDDSEPEKNVNVAVDDVPCDRVEQSDLLASKDTPQTLATSDIDDMAVRVDAPEESVLDINKDVVSSILGNTKDMDVENEQRFTEVDESFEHAEEEAGSKDDMTVRVNALEESVLDINKDVVSSILGNINDMDVENEERFTEVDESFEHTEEESGMGRGTTSKGLLTDVITEGPLVSVSKVAVVEEGVDISSLGVVTKGNNGDADKNCDSIPHNVGSSTINGLNELETGLEMSNVNKTTEVPFTGNSIDIECCLEDNSDVQDGESKHDQLTSNDNQATDEEDVEGDDSEPTQNECIASADSEPETVLNVAVDDVSCDGVDQSDLVASKDTPLTLATSEIDDMAERVDALEESVLDINKDVVSSSLDDMDVENEQRFTEVDESFEQTKEEAGTSRGNDDTFNDQEPAAATDDFYSDSGKFKEGGSHIGVSEVDSELVGNMKAHENPTGEEASPILYTEGESTNDGIDSIPLMGDSSAHENLITKESSPVTYRKEESPVDYTDSDLPTIKEDDRNKQGSYVDWGDYDFGMDEFEKPVSADRSSEVVGEADGEDSDLHTSARPSFSIEESSGLASSVRNFEKDSRDAADGNTEKDVDVLKESANAANMTEEVFNWSDSPLKSLFTTPATTKICHVIDVQEDATSSANTDYYSSMKSLFKTPAVTQTSHAKDGQEDAVANQDPYSSLRPLSKTPAVTQTSHAKDGQEDAVDNQDPHSLTPAVTQTSHAKDGQEDAVANQDPYSSLKQLFKTPAFTQISRVKDGQEDAVANQDPYSSQKSLLTTPATSRTSNVNDNKTDAGNSASFTFPYGRRNEDMGTGGTAAHEYSHQWENDQQKAFDSNAVRSSENEMYGVPSFEDYSFGDEDVGGPVDGSRGNTHFEFKGDQVDQIKQFEFLSAGTSHQDPSGLKDNSIHSRELEKKEAPDDDLAFDTGDV